MSRQQLIDLLNDDLSNEYYHMHFYLHASVMIRGLHRAELSEFFSEQAVSEMKHVRQFSNLILGLGCVPSTVYKPIPSTTCDFDLLSYAINMENEVVENYSTRIDQATELGGVDGKVIQIFLEEQLLDSRTDADHMRQMLK